MSGWRMPQPHVRDGLRIRQNRVSIWINSHIQSRVIEFFLTELDAGAQVPVAVDDAPGITHSRSGDRPKRLLIFSGNNELSDTPARVLFVLVLSCGILAGCATVVTLTNPVLPDGRVW